jgi:hypothetical protein
MKIISNWMQSISSTWLMAATTMIMIGFMVFVLPAQSETADQISGGAGSPDLSFYYSPEVIYRFAEAYGPEGRQAYIRARWSFDLIFPMVYASFLGVGISWLFQQLPNWPETWKYANLLPVMGCIFDILENSGTSLVMASYPAHQPVWSILASISTPVKWSFVTSSFLIYFILAGGVLLRWIRSTRLGSK